MAMRAQSCGQCTERDGSETGIPKGRLPVGSKIKDNAGASGDWKPEKKPPLGRLDFDCLLKSLPRGARELREAQAKTRRGEAVRKGCSRPLRHRCPPAPTQAFPMIIRVSLAARPQGFSFVLSVLNRARPLGPHFMIAITGKRIRLRS